MSRKFRFMACLAMGSAAFGQTGGFTVAGFYIDANQVNHAFVRSAAGDFTTFEAPAASDAKGSGTSAASINGSGAVAGTYGAAGPEVDLRLDSFARTASGAIADFAAPPASGRYPQESTQAMGINNAGAIAGFDIARDLATHAFLRSPAGVFTNFDAPGAASGPNGGTWAVAINNAGDIAGYYMDANLVFHGFIRTPAGAYTTFEDPNAGTNHSSGYPGTVAYGINDAGAVVGMYTDANGVSHGFVRTLAGVFTTIDAPGAGTALYLGTTAFSINDAGTIAGYYLDAIKFKRQLVQNCLLSPFHRKQRFHKYRVVSGRHDPRTHPLFGTRADVVSSLCVRMCPAQEL